MSEIISTIAFPIIVLRYLYPSYIIMWFLLSVNLSKLKLNRLYAVLLVIFIISNCFENYSNVLKSERANNKRLKSTLELTQPNINEKSFMYTDIVHLAWTVEKVYYPNTPNNLFGHAEWWGPLEIPELDPNVDYWLFLSNPISDDIVSNLNGQGYNAEIVVDNGFIGTGNVWIYHALRN